MSYWRPIDECRWVMVMVWRKLLFRARDRVIMHVSPELNSTLGIPTFIQCMRAREIWLDAQACLPACLARRHPRFGKSS